MKTNITYIKIICLNLWIKALFDKLELNYRMKLQSIPHIVKGMDSNKGVYCNYSSNCQVIQLIA